MAYQVVKGWPSDCAIDEIITLATEGTVAPGMAGVIGADGEGVLGTFPLTAGATSTLPAFFCIDEDTVTKKVTGLMNRVAIEVDADHYVAGAFAPGKSLSLGATEANSGKFELIAASGDARPVVAKVINYNATTGKLRLLWVA